ncbi:MAG: putative transposase [Arenicella sp.]|jgi:putative transposase
MKDKTSYRRSLPHINPLGGTYFVTFCLKDTLSQPEVARLIDKNQHNLNLLKSNPKASSLEIDILSRRQFGELDKAIHEAKGKHYLKDDELAEKVANAIQFWDDKRINLMAYCVMSNHVHLVLRLLEDDLDKLKVFLIQIIKSIKQFSARECNKLLGLSGAFWQPESFDRLVRDREELHRIISYVLDNPTKAGLCQNRVDWTWNYVKEEYNEFM